MFRDWRRNGLAGLLVALWFSAPGEAREWRLQSELAHLAGPGGWRAEGIALDIRQGADQASLRLDLERLQLPTPLPTLSGLSVHCPRLTLDAERLACESGSLSLADGREAALGFSYELADGALSFNLAGLDLQPGVISVAGNSGPTGWRLETQSRGLPGGLLNTLVEEFLDLGLASASGATDLDLDLSGDQSGLQTLKLTLASPALDFASADGLRAAEALRGDLSGDWNLQSGDFTAALRLAGGQLYWDPVFIQADPDLDPIVLRVSGSWNDLRLRLDEVYFRHPNVIKAEARLTLEGTTLRGARIEVLGAAVDGLYNTYLRPLLGSPSWPGLSARGYVKGAVLIDQGRLSALETSFLDVDLALDGETFAMENFGGWLDWQADGSAREIHFNWATASVYRLPLGPLNLWAESRGPAVQLVKPLRLPVLDGALSLDTLKGSLEPLSLVLDGRLEPLSLTALSDLLGGPPLSGTVAGVVPGMRYRPGLLDVGGDIRIQVFGGDIQVESLRLEEPLGPLPRLLADLSIHRLDLGRITQTYDIGGIQGYLDGGVQGLVLENWKPVRFDAHLATPAQQPGERRISQRAVETLSSVGGAGASAALSRGVLNLFEEFSYRRLGIRCRLESGICQMGGVAPAGSDSYYLVEGGGLPRIDVIGYTRQVDWQDLLNRLQAAMQSGAPEIR